MRHWLRPDGEHRRWGIPLSLTYDRDRQCFFLKTTKLDDGHQLGMQLFTGDCTPGHYTFFTSKLDGVIHVPTFNPYQVLEKFGEADASAAAILLDLRVAYADSLALDRPIDLQAPAGLEYSPYQRAAISYAANRKGVLLGDEPGLGKTVEALGVCNKVGARRILVVCPAAVRLQWRKEIKRWCPQYKNVRAVLQSKNGYDPEADATILSYEMARSEKFWPLLMEDTFDVLILDEAHYLKNHEAKRTQRILGGYAEGTEGLASRAGRTLALTGTPLPNRPRECYTLMRALNWPAIGNVSWDQFCTRYNPQQMHGEYSKNLGELQARMRCHVMVRRLKKDVLKDLPPKRYELALVETNGAIKNVLKAESLLDINPEDPGSFLGADGKIDGAIATVRKDMGLAKIPRIIEHAEYVLRSGVNKLVLFLYHREVIAAVTEALAGYDPAVIKGGITPPRRERERCKFVDQKQCRILIGQLLATGTGTDGLQHVCDRVVFGEADWVPGNNDQGVDRLHRRGQEGSVLAEFLVAQGSLDEKILGGAIAKLHTTNETLDRRLL